MLGTFAFFLEHESLAAPGARQGLDEALPQGEAALRGPLTLCTDSSLGSALYSEDKGVDNLLGSGLARRRHMDGENRQVWGTAL